MCGVLQVMKAERNRRGIKAEMEESREILDAYVEENRVLVALLARGRGLVQTLQMSSTDAALQGSPLMQVEFGGNPVCGAAAYRAYVGYTWKATKYTLGYLAYM